MQKLEKLQNTLETSGSVPDFYQSIPALLKMHTELVREKNQEIERLITDKVPQQNYMKIDAARRPSIEMKCNTLKSTCDDWQIKLRAITEDSMDKIVTAELIPPPDNIDPLARSTADCTGELHPDHHYTL